MRPLVGVTRPRMARSSEVLPAPFGPRIAVNDPGAMSIERSVQIRLLPYSTVTRSKRTAGALPRSGYLFGERGLELGKLREDPLLVGLELRRDGLGHAHDRDPARSGQVVDVLRQRRGDLAVVEEDLDPPAGQQIALGRD